MYWHSTKYCRKNTPHTAVCGGEKWIRFQQHWTATLEQENRWSLPTDIHSRIPWSPGTDRCLPNSYTRTREQMATTHPRSLLKSWWSSHSRTRKMRTRKNTGRCTQSLLALAMVGSHKYGCCLTKHGLLSRQCFDLSSATVFGGSCGIKFRHIWIHKTRVWGWWIHQTPQFSRPLIKLPAEAD